MSEATEQLLADVSDSTGSSDGDGGKKLRISDKTITRMRWYLFALDEFEKQNMTVVASREIAQKVGVKPGLVRKDLCHFGGFGRPSVGYHIGYLKKQIREILRINQVKNVAWVGVQRLTEDIGLARRCAENNCEIVAVFDSDPVRIGSRVENLQVMAFHGIEQVVSDVDVEAAVIAVPECNAQLVADRLIAGGVKAILNLTPAVLAVPPGVTVRSIDLVSELMMLSYYCGEPQCDRIENDSIPGIGTDTEVA
jgi:redox-sensing transcriptional repressor